ncbi:UNKNOWN [Stylonychia lemnae]|uniref:Uncharacterized protein n=1 Tax=Stylonychia lemnae TaxID=5949 RepID=A0A077ZS93_STYLE|nr:UNKNOWN [Stylonychia lemnae]|eukprot:CDW72389.1 UNKNOWN [Stylonychia lemnae]
MEELESKQSLDNLANFFTKQPQIQKLLSESRDFADFKAQKVRELDDDTRYLKIQQLESENQQLKQIVQEMRKEIEQIRDRTMNQNAHAQSIFELRREVYKLQADKKSLELEKEFLENNHNQFKDNSNILKELNDKESELYEAKIKLIQKDNEVMGLNQRLNTLDRQVIQYRTERDKLLEISNELRAQISRFEREQENQRTNALIMRNQPMQSNSNPFQQTQSDDLQESKLDKLRLEVEQMRNMVNQFKIENKDPNTTDQFGERPELFQKKDHYKVDVEKLRSPLHQKSISSTNQFQNQQDHSQFNQRVSFNAMVSNKTSRDQSREKEYDIRNSIKMFERLSVDQQIQRQQLLFEKEIDNQLNQLHEEENQSMASSQPQKQTKREKSKRRLQELKQTYNSSQLEEMFPVRDSINF